jgi:non-canonical poly(A) RNA polymerase PAPD5/7
MLLTKLTPIQLLAARYHLAAFDPAQPYMLSLQDPADPLNDLGRKAFGFKHIRATFAQLHRHILSFQFIEKDPCKSMLGELVGPCYEAYQKRREIAEAFGRAALVERELGDGLDGN